MRMSQSLAKILTHIIFSTKHRRALIAPSVQEELKAYLIGALKNLDSPSLETNCAPDHVHILCCMSKNLALTMLLEQIKKSSSKWIKTKGPAFTEFYWQTGYGAFSVSESNVDAVRDYIKRQEEHHRRMTFQEEFRQFLERHKVDYDERYVWD